MVIYNESTRDKSNISKYYYNMIKQLLGLSGNVKKQTLLQLTLGGINQYLTDKYLLLCLPRATKQVDLLNPSSNTTLAHQRLKTQNNNLKALLFIPAR